jgi:hypothetical protein
LDLFRVCSENGRCEVGDVNRPLAEGETGGGQKKYSRRYGLRHILNLLSPAAEPRQRR